MWKLARSSFNAFISKDDGKILVQRFANWSARNGVPFPMDRKTEDGKKFILLYDYNRTTKPEYFYHKFFTEQDYTKQNDYDKSII